MKFDWSMDRAKNFETSLNSYRNYLADNGFRYSTIDGYISNITRYLKFAGTERSSGQQAAHFRNNLDDPHSQWIVGRGEMGQKNYLDRRRIILSNNSKRIR